MALDQLRAHHAVATFFLVGKLVHQPWLSSDLRAETHFPGLAFGDHTWDHVSVKHASTKFLNQEILRARAAIARAAGVPISLFRPPLGAHDANLGRYLRAHRMLQILWSIDSRDSQGASASKIYRIVRDGLSPGDIILLHDNRGTTEKALPRILDLIDRQGLTTVTVPELLSQDPPSAKQVRTHTCP
jgi:peptidoglycan/xylan/chitin deacetylase (PgdA/CDA1 family)